jgi:N-acetylneuraminate synthase/N,N'-diacetyllegionaminate synthase
MSKVMVIAEAGVNHNGSIQDAFSLCRAAQGAGADVVKFQTYIPEKSVRPGKDYDLLARLALPLDDFRVISAYCRDIGIEFCSTPDDLVSLKFLVEECGVRRIKIGSGSLLHDPLVDACFETGLPVLLSTGMATLDEIIGVVNRQRMRWVRDPTVTRGMNQLTIMHCVSLYPCPPHLANVNAIVNICRLGAVAWRPDFLSLGYSDHTVGAASACAAVAVGATVVEKHLTLDKNADGPDHAMSASPLEFEWLVRSVRATEEVLGEGKPHTWTPSPEEAKMIPRIRKDADGLQAGI